MICWIYWYIYICSYSVALCTFFLARRLCVRHAIYRLLLLLCLLFIHSYTALLLIYLLYFGTILYMTTTKYTFFSLFSASLLSLLHLPLYPRIQFGAISKINPCSRLRYEESGKALRSNWCGNGCSCMNLSFQFSTIRLNMREKKRIDALANTS